MNVKMSFFFLFFYFGIVVSIEGKMVASLEIPSTGRQLNPSSVTKKVPIRPLLTVSFSVSQIVSVS